MLSIVAVCKCWISCSTPTPHTQATKKKRQHCERCGPHDGAPTRAPLPHAHHALLTNTRARTRAHTHGITLLVSELQGFMTLTCRRLHPISTSPTTVADKIHPVQMLSINGKPLTRIAVVTSVIESEILKIAISAPKAPHCAILEKLV